MKLTVAHKVILGFGFIALLLLFASLSSLWSFAVVSDSGSRVNDIAVPVQQQSNQAQIQLLKLGKLSALGFMADQAKTISQFQSDFANANNDYRQKVTALHALTASDPTLNKALTTADQQHELYSTAVNNMFKAKLTTLQAGEAAAVELKQLVQLIDDAGATLVDLSYLETPGKKNQLELLAGAASRVDGQLLTLMQTVRETAAFTELSQLTESQQNIEFALSDMQGNLDYIGDLVDEVDATDLWQTFNQQLSAVKARVATEQNLVSLKRQQLTALQDARAQLANSEQAIGLAIAALDQLLKAADQQFTSLQAEVSSALSFGKARTIIIMVVLVVLAGGAAFLTINAMLKPLAGINKVLGEVAGGDLTRRLHIEQEDEFGALSAKVNSLIEALSQLIHRIVASSGELEHNASRSRDEVQEINRALQTQQTQINDVNQTTQQLNDNTHNIAQQAEQAVEEMQHALGQSQQIDKISGENNTLISGLAGQLASTADIMLKVNTHSNNIGGILATIRGIAEQTNLLALNAAIEAARAGEQGRGFAVVADEVRSLAVRSQAAVDEIRQMIQTLQQESTAAVSAINRGKTDAEYCVNHTADLVQSLGHVNQAISQMHHISTAIASATQQQLALGGLISDHMGAMVLLSDQSSEKADRTLQHSAAVSDNAGQLTAAISTFKI
ncbi:MAG: methyl-accepting chemotaxis protein [Rheinheimera sp.]|nr:methyl-accepting chemotaxis protein [Rheinheimera sp.]